VAAPFEIPDRSQLVVRGTRRRHRRLSLEVRGSDGAIDRIEAPTAGNATDVSELKLEDAQVGHGDGARRRHSAAELAVPGDPDHPPKIAITKDPEKSPRGALKLFFKVEDDYGVVSAESRIKRMRPKEDKTATAWARAGAKKGARPPHERPPALALRLPRAYPKQAEGQSFHEIGDHLWAGHERSSCRSSPRTCLASPGAAPQSRSSCRAALHQAAGRAVVEQRRRLVEDPRDRPCCGPRASPALTLEPEGFIEDLQVFLGLRSAYWRLQRDGDASAAQQRHRRSCGTSRCASRMAISPMQSGHCAPPRTACQKALEQGASDEEIQKIDAGAEAGAGPVPGAIVQAGAESAAHAGHGPQQPVHDASRISSRCSRTSRTWRARATATWRSRC
jgi:hypothetical protein